jgi:hypothetical protein
VIFRLVSFTGAAPGIYAARGMRNWRIDSPHLGVRVFSAL